MHSIHLMEFTGYEQKDIYAYLLANNETHFRIIVEKLFIAPGDDNMDIAAEYYDAIYYGQKLAALSSNFCYYVPSEFSALPFVYELSTTDMEQLAGTMFYLIRGILLHEETTDIMDKYLDDKEIFWDQYCNNKIDPVCHGLIHIMKKLQSAG
jgi:hypothetical protein